MDANPECENRSPTTTHISAHSSVTTAIISTIAEARGIDIDQLESLNDTIDFDSLDSLFTKSDELQQTELQITFTVADCKVILYGDGRLVVAPATAHSSQRHESELATTYSEEL